jgi:hypothetical protein
MGDRTGPTLLIPIGSVVELWTERAYHAADERNPNTNLAGKCS